MAVLEQRIPLVWEAFQLKNLESASEMLALVEPYGFVPQVAVF